MAAATASAAAAVAATNATAAAAAAAAASAAAADAAAEESAAAAASGKGGVLSFLDPPTSEAEAFAAAAITERYRVLGEEADARAARARWKRRRSSRVVAARAALKVLYAEESHLWKGMAAQAGEAMAGAGTPGVEPQGTGPARTAEDSEAALVASLGGSSDSGSGKAGRVAGESQARALGQGASDDGGGISEVETEVEREEAGDATVRGGTPVVLERHVKHSEDTKFSPVTIVDEPGGKSAGVSAALDSTADEALGPKFSHVNIVQEPGGKSSGVSEALGADIGGGGSGGGVTDAAAGSLPGRSGVRRIVQGPGGDSHAVSRIMNPNAGSSSSGDRASGVGGGIVDSASPGPARRADVQGSGDTVPGLLFSSVEEMAAAAAAAAAAATVAVADVEGGPGGDGRGGETLKPGPLSSEGSPVAGASSYVAPAPPPQTPALAARDQEPSSKHRGALPGSKQEQEESSPGRRAAGAAQAFLPLELMVTRCVREPVLAQCGAVDSAALAFLVRDAGVAEHLASLRTFLLGLTSDFLHDFTLRLLDGIYDGG